MTMCVAIPGRRWPSPHLLGGVVTFLLSEVASQLMEHGAPENRTRRPQVTGIEEAASHPARALSLHLLRMLETRMDAAGIALQSEMQRFG